MLDGLRDLMRPPAGMAFDFSQPAGEPALAPSETAFHRLSALVIGALGRVGAQRFPA